MMIGFWICISDCFSQSGQNKIALAGSWELALDSMSTGPKQLTFNNVIKLPGTLGEASIGRKYVQPQGLSLRDVLQAGPGYKYSYSGKAWYRRKISVPSWAKGKTAVLTFERVMWKSTLYIDGKETGSQNSLTIPQRYEVTDYLTPGQHEIMICVDNSLPSNLGRSRIISRAWNGLLGDLSISFYDRSFISGTSIYPDAEKKNVRVKTYGHFDSPDVKQIRFRITDKRSGKTITESVKEINSANEYLLGFDSEVSLWDEFNPALYILESSIIKNGKPVASRSDIFGFRKIESRGKVMTMNGKPMFLRGTLGSKAVPPAEHTMTSYQDYARIIGLLKSYGLNHIRYHSQSCPPEAAFEVADNMGFYFQIECPIWSLDFGKNPEVVSFVREEANRIIAEYGNHPSFCLFSIGNEMEGDFKIMTDLITDLKAKDNRFLYTTTSFTFQKDHGMYPEKIDDFLVTQWTDAGWVRGQGFFDLEYPEFDKDYLSTMSQIPVPLINHETGQWTTYPDLKIIEKYNNIMMPLNLEAIRAEVEKKGMSDLVDKYVNATGKLQVLLYKEEIERALKTFGLSGFQLLGIADGGGNTPIDGVLDALWNPKKYIDSTEYHQFCSELVPLAWFKSSVRSNAEPFELEIGVANYYMTLKNRKLICELSDNSGSVLQQKELIVPEITGGKTQKYGQIKFDLTRISEPRQLKLVVRVDGTKYRNSWPVWIYPEKVSLSDDQILVTTSFDEARRALDQGRKVLLSPPLERIKGTEGVFTTVFWSPTHFSHWERVAEAGTMGLLIDPAHPAFSQFPTDFHSNWQWWDLCKKSQTMNFNNIDIQPLIRVIDNYYNNRNLTNLFEVKAGNGKLIFSSIDLISDLDNRIEARQLRHSLIEYMKSSRFDPRKSISVQSLSDNFIVGRNWQYIKYRATQQ